MADRKTDTSPLMEKIPSDLLAPEQVARWHHAGERSTYRFLRNPLDLKELNKQKRCFAVWSDNGTLTYVVPRNSYDLAENYHLSLHYDDGPTLYIFGLLQDAVARTAEFFLGLEKKKRADSEFSIEGRGTSALNFRALSSMCFTQLFTAAPKRSIRLENIRLSIQQATILASRPHPISLRLEYCEFEDGGVAFIETLENRKTSFGSLFLDESVPFDDENLKRFLQIDTIEFLSLPHLKNKIAFLPFSTKAGHLRYQIVPSLLLNAASLNLVTEKLDLTIEETEDEEIESFPKDPVLSFLRRLAEFNHLVEFKIRFDFLDCDSKIPKSVVKELIRVVNTHPNMKVLDLSIYDDDLEWDRHVQTLFDGIKNHKGLRTVILNVDEAAFGPRHQYDYSYLQELLTNNRYIEVMNDNRERYWGDETIRKLYRLNHFYRGSLSLSTDPSPERQVYVAKALLGSALKSFQRSALLLSDHADILFELLQLAPQDELSEQEGTSPSPAIQRRKRKRETAHGGSVKTGSGAHS